MKTATARRGDLVIYANGSGKLISANEASFGFGAGGEVTQINVRVGDEVNVGDVLADLNNASVLLSYEQAKRNLAQLTSPAAIASARQNLSLAEDELAAAAASLKYLISPSVLTWEERLVEAQAGLKSAQEAAQAIPPTKIRRR
jgi:multidrug efflux pump subunit AcrA (membrane-fusion protein)